MEVMKDPGMAGKINKLVAAGILKMGWETQRDTEYADTKRERDMGEKNKSKVIYL